MKTWLVVPAVTFAAFAALILGGIALTGGLRLRSPVADMKRELERFTLEDDEIGSITQEPGDRICFLQCAEWMVALDVRRPNAVDLGSECAQLSERLAAWSGVEVERIKHPTDATYCGLAVSGSSLGHPDWSVTASLELEDRGLAQWSLHLIAE